MRKLLFLSIGLLLSWQSYSQVFSALGTGLDFSPKELIAAGDSIWALEQRGDTVLQLHLWNGQFWVKMPQLRTNKPIAGKVRMCSFFNSQIGENEIYISGNFDQVNSISNSARLVRWSEGAWKSLGAGLRIGQLNQINDLQVYNGELYIAGRIQVVDDKDMKNIARWNGQVWNYVNLGTDGEIYDMDTCQRKLWVAGEFKNTGGSYNPYLSCFNGYYWYPHPAFVVKKLQAPVEKLGNHDGHLLIYGDFSAQDSSLTGQNILMLLGNSWQHAGRNLLDPQSGYNWTSINGELYLVGDVISTLDGMPHTAFKFDGTDAWIPLPQWDYYGMERIVMTNQGMVCSGHFTAVDGIHQRNIVRECPECAKITGNVFRDFNSNCLYEDTVDLPYTKPFVLMNPGNNIYSVDDNGQYVIDVPEGNYTLELVGQPWYVPCAPVSINAVKGQIYHVDLGTTLQNGSVDIATSLSAGGNDAELYKDGVYTVTVQNLGAVTVSVQLKLQHDPRMGYQGSSQAPTQYVPYELSWNVPSLKAGEVQIIRVIFNASAYFSLGDTAFFKLSATASEPDMQLANNEDSIRVVITPFRPVLEKTVRPVENEAHGNIFTDTKALRYTIRFQNPTQQVINQLVIQDTIQFSVYQFDSFVVTGSSHPIRKLEAYGRSSVRFRFENMNLMPVGLDPIASQGFVEFEVFTKNLNAGQQINNTAFLYFDYFLPMATNTVENKVLERPANGIWKDELSLGHKVYPNPSDGHISLQVPADGAYELRVYDLSGKMLMEQGLEVVGGLGSADLSALQTGWYLLQLSKGGESFNMPLEISR